MNIYVTGLGVVSAIGLNTFENFNSLRKEESGIKYNKTYNELFGQVSLSNNQLAEELNLNESEHSRTTLLGLKASKEALSKLPSNLYSSLAFISATSVGGIDRTEEVHFKSLENPDEIIPSIDLTYENGITSERIAKELGISGYINTISTACSSGANAIMMGARLIRSGKFNRVLVGGIDPLAQLNISGFRSLGVYDDNLCKPFDKNRKGLNLGEGAAFLLLENDESIKESGTDKLCLISGWANTADAFHQTASSEEGVGAILSMSQALKTANLAPNQINYINAHGTGTMNNDASEFSAISSVFDLKVPKFSSTKCYTGHTLAAAGAIEAVYSVLSIINQCIFPTYTFETPVGVQNIQPQSKYLEPVKIKHVLSNSFGFGGNCTTLIFSSNQ